METARRDYALRFIANLAGVSAAGADISESIIASTWHALSRQEEVDNPIRDQWGNWDWPFCAAQRRGEVYKPWLDESLQPALNSLRGNAVPEPLWPEKKPFALCLTHDVDLVSAYPTMLTPFKLAGRAINVSAHRGAVARAALIAGLRFGKNLLLQRPDPLWHYEDWVKAEDKHGMRSSFFFFPPQLSKPHLYDCTYDLGDAVRYDGKRMRVSEMMREMHRGGWDVGLHGSYHSATEGGLLSGQKLQIENALGAPVYSTRQHWLHYDVRVTPRMQAEAEFQTDSTQGFNRTIGFRAGTAFPYWTWDSTAQRPTKVLQIPQHIMDGALFTGNALEYNEELATKHCVELMDAVQRVGGCLTLSWHPNYLNEAKWWNVYKTLLEEGARRNAWGCSCKQLYDWWAAREQRIASKTGAKCEASR